MWQNKDVLSAVIYFYLDSDTLSTFEVKPEREHNLTVLINYDHFNTIMTQYHVELELQGLIHLWIKRKSAGNYFNTLLIFSFHFKGKIKLYL